MPHSSGSSVVHPPPQPRYHMSCCQNSNCGHGLLGASAAPAQPAAIWPPFPPLSDSLLPFTLWLIVGSRLCKFPLLLPLLCSQAAGWMPSIQPHSSTVNPFFFCQPSVLPIVFSSPDPKSRHAEITVYACIRCPALLSASPVLV